MLVYMSSDLGAKPLAWVKLHMQILRCHCLLKGTCPDPGMQCRSLCLGRRHQTLLAWPVSGLSLLPSTVNPCELHCRPENEYFAEKLRDAVVDGTSCYGTGNSSRDMCINGICKVGRDFGLPSKGLDFRGEA